MKKLLAIILIFSIICCFAGCRDDNSDKEINNTTTQNVQNTESVKDAFVNNSNSEEFRKEFISLAEKNATKTSEPLPQKWDGKPIFQLGDKTIHLPINVQDFINITGYDFTASGPNEDGTGDWETKMIKSNQIDSFFDFFRYEEFDENDNPTKISLLEIGVYNPYNKETVAGDCYVVYVVFGVGAQSDLNLVINEDKVTYPKVTFSGGIKMGDTITADDLSNVFGENLKNSTIEDLETYWFYGGEDGKFVIQTVKDEIEYAECFYKLPIEAQNITLEENYPPRDLWKNFECKDN